MKVVCDAKYYTSQLSQGTVDKTVDDLYLRCDDVYEAYGLLICSENTKLNEYESQPQDQKLFLIKLVNQPEETFV